MGISKIIRVGVACVATTILLSTASFAQTRTMNANSPGVLRSWPAHGKWRVLLSHTSDGRYVCLNVTGKMSEGGDTYLLGLDVAPENLFVILADRNPEAVRGDAVKMLIDNTLVGTYAVGKRSTSGELSMVRAAVPKADADRLLRLLEVGGVVQFETDDANYSADLDGMPGALVSVRDCLAEAVNLKSNK